MSYQISVILLQTVLLYKVQKVDIVALVEDFLTGRTVIFKKRYETAKNSHTDYKS